MELTPPVLTYTEPGIVECSGCGTSEIYLDPVMACREILAHVRQHREAIDEGREIVVH